MKILTETGNNLVTEEGEFLIEETEEREEDEADVVSYEINSYPADITLQGYVDKWKKGQLIIPEFQRGYVWDKVRASKLIESFLIGLPVPNVFLYQERKNKNLLIVDGQQRIHSAIMFFNGDSKFQKLTNVRSQWEGKTYETLDEVDRNQLNDSILRATIIQQIDPDDDTSIYQIFERLNTGSVALNPMEIRKCVNSGDFFNLLQKLNELPTWRSILGKSSPDKRLKDIEFILRCLALAEDWRNYKKPMKGFLNDYMASTKKFDSNRLAHIEQEFTKICEKLGYLNPEPFHLRGRINYAVMDSIFYAVSENLDKNDKTLKLAYEELRKHSEYIMWVTQNTSDVEVLKNRFRIASNVFNAFSDE